MTFCERFEIFQILVLSHGLPSAKMFDLEYVCLFKRHGFEPGIEPWVWGLGEILNCVNQPLNFWGSQRGEISGTHTIL